MEIYNGNWINNKREGNGIMKYNNEDDYVGDLKNDIKEGKGKMKYLFRKINALIL